MAVAFKGASATITGGTTACTAVAPTGGAAPAADDIVLIVAESSDSMTAAGTPNTPAAVPNKIFEETQGNGATGVCTLTVFAVRATGAIGDVTIDGVGNHCSAVMLVYSGAVTSGTAWTVGTGNGANTGNGTMTGLNTPDANCMVLMICASTRDANTTTNFSSWTNANLTSIQERADSCVTTGAGGGFGVAEGLKATAGGTGDSTVTIGVSAQWRSVHVALAPAATPVTGTLSSTLGAATLVGVAAIALAGVSTPTLGEVTSASTAQVEAVGASAPTLGAVTLSGDTDVIALGAAANDLGAVTIAADAAVTTTINAVLDASLGADSLSASAGVGVAAADSSTLGEVTASSGAAVGLAGTASNTLGAATLSSSAEVVSSAVTASLGSTLGAVTLSAEAIDPPIVAGATGTLAVTLGPIVAYASNQQWPWLIAPGEPRERNIVSFPVTPGGPS